MRKGALIFFSLLYGAGGIFVILISGLASNYIPYVGLAYIVLGIPILCLIYFFLNRAKIRYKTIIFSGIALILLFLFYPILEIEQYRVKQTISKTKVWDVHDGVFFSGKGNPLGISLRYKLQIPKNAYYGEQGGPLFAELYPENAYFSESDFFMRQAFTFNRKPLESSEDGVVYEVTTELLPHFLAYNDEKKEWCIETFMIDSGKKEQELLDDFEKTNKRISTRFRISIPWTSYTSTNYTNSSYIPEDFYDSAIKEGFKKIKLAPPTSSIPCEGT